MESNNTVTQFLDLYDQVQLMYTNSKLPKFLAKIRIAMYKRKIIKSVDKLYVANVPMNSSDVIDMLTNIQSANLPTGAYKQFEFITVDYNSIRAKLSTRDFNFYISISNNEPEIMDLNLKYIDHNKTGFNISAKELKGNSEETKEALRFINSVMWCTAADFIKESIMSN